MSMSRGLLAVCVLAALTGSAFADPKTGAPAPASSFAPHPTRQRAFGAPIQKPILHRRHKRTARPATAAKAPAPAPAK